MANLIRCYQRSFLTRPVLFGLRLPTHPSRLQVNTTRLTHGDFRPPRLPENTTQSTRPTYDGRTLYTTGAKTYPSSNTKGSNPYWTIDDLKMFNITVARQDAATFFGQAVLPVPPHHHELLHKLTADEMTNDESYHVARYMEMAMNPVECERSAIDDFAVHLLRAMGYRGRASGRSLCTGKNIPLCILGKWRFVRGHVCVLDRDEFIVLIQENKQHKSTVDPEPQLIFKAVAAVHSNNQLRRLLGLDPVDVNVMAGISMTGSSPAFFKVPVTTELLEVIQTGKSPATPTVVAVYYPELPRPTQRFKEGMRPLDNRRSILACFEGFKQFVN
jgi:hypothetical protein